MSLVKVTEVLWVNPERVLAVEQRSVTSADGTTRTYVEVTMETHLRWSLDLPLNDVLGKLLQW